MTTARSQQIDIETTPYYHVINRCVRRAFLCGEDQLTGQNYEHRRGWIVDKIKSLSSIFAMDICAFAVMSNHYHIVLRVDKELAESWSDLETAEHWMQLFNAPLLVANWLSGQEQCKAELDIVAEIIQTWRDRLWDISWFMRTLNEFIAREANKEDDCKGRFWEGRFKSQALLDESAVLSCMAYVDLNPVRAGMADTPENSEFTSIYERIKAYADCHSGEAHQSAFDLVDFQDMAVEKDKAIPFDFDEYLKLIDWSGRAILENKRGSIPERYPNILLRLGIKDKDWLQSILFFEHRFPTVAGELKRMRQLAEETGRKWIRGQRSGFALSTSC
ncbi:MAG: transposase [Gammaproteobacteria bacterium]|nr:transposase [Gammaproteobacteria bacterium]